MTSPKPGGWNDRRALRHAIALNRRMTATMRRIIEGNVGQGRVLELATRIGLDLADQRDVLAEMAEIRSTNDNDAN